MKIQRVSYETAPLEDLREFYLETLGLPVAADADDRFAVEVGETVVEFTRAAGGTDPFYHFTWDVPENQFQRAKAWLGERTELLESPEGDDEVYFEQLDFHSAYFFDPAGNLVEFAARHTLDTAREGPFTAADLVRVSEVGLPVEDVRGVVETLETDVGITLHPKLEGVSPVLAAVGDDEGMFPIMREWKEWFMTDKAARAHPVTVELGGDGPDRYEFEDAPYVLTWES